MARPRSQESSQRPSPERSTGFRSPRRISITIPLRTYERLVKRSDEEGRSMSNLASFILESWLDSEDHHHGSSS
jgi:hypothetical protein